MCLYPYPLSWTPFPLSLLLTTIQSFYICQSRTRRLLGGSNTLGPGTHAQHLHLLAPYLLVLSRLVDLASLTDPTHICWSHFCSLVLPEPTACLHLLILPSLIIHTHWSHSQNSYPLLSLLRVIPPGLTLKAYTHWSLPPNSYSLVSPQAYISTDLSNLIHTHWSCPCPQYLGPSISLNISIHWSWVQHLCLGNCCKLSPIYKIWKVSQIYSPWSSSPPF